MTLTIPIALILETRRRRAMARPPCVSSWGQRATDLGGTPAPNFAAGTAARGLPRRPGPLSRSSHELTESGQVCRPALARGHPAGGSHGPSFRTRSVAPRGGLVASGGAPGPPRRRRGGRRPRQPEPRRSRCPSHRVLCLRLTCCLPRSPCPVCSPCRAAAAAAGVGGAAVALPRAHAPARPASRAVCPCPLRWWPRASGVCRGCRHALP